MLSADSCLLALQVAELHRLVSEGIASGEVAPLPFTAFSGARVQDAFQHLLPGGFLTSVCAASCCLGAR